MFYLFGDAKVTYESYKLTAGKIRLDMDHDIAYAEGVLDSNGKWKELPHFSDGQQEFDAHKMRYNFRTRKGIIDQVVSKYTDVYIRGTTTKFIGGDPKDTTQKDIVFNRNAILTSCNAERPHFGIRSTKQKFIKDRMVVIGPFQPRDHGSAHTAVATVWIFSYI
jgi:lipopolysaccharide assembly outer membrane protein LptD (OstA)